MAGERRLLSTDYHPPSRPLLPQDVTLDELWWLYHNHPLVHQFVDHLIAEAEANWQRHHVWEQRTMKRE